MSGWLRCCSKACIFGPMGRSSKPGTIDCPEEPKTLQPAGITKRLLTVEAQRVDQEGKGYANQLSAHGSSGRAHHP
jgi:hypothetical protein